MALTITTTKRQQPLHIMVFGSPGKRKTSSLITASAKCPENETHLIVKGQSRKQPAEVNLDDLLVVSFEPSATAGWAQLNYVAPELDLTTALDPMDFPGDRNGAAKFGALLKEAHKAIEKSIEGGTKVVGIDGPTFADGLFQEAVGHFYPNLEGAQFWGQVLQFHRDWFLPLLRMNATFIHIFHADSKPADMGGKSDAAVAIKEAAELRKKAWGMADISPALSGKAKALYRGASVMTLYADRGLQMVNGKMTDGYWFHVEHMQYDVKKRFELDAVLPADFRVVFGQMGLTR